MHGVLNSCCKTVEMIKYSVEFEIKVENLEGFIVLHV